MRPLIGLVFFSFVFNVSFSQEKTIADLQEAYKFESGNKSLFMAYADKASEEGYPSIALFFKSISSVSGIHASNFEKVLGKMGIEAIQGNQVIGVATTGDNLQEAFRSVRIEAGIKYTEYLEVAKSENQTTAVKAIRWAKETHQQSLQIYLNTIEAFNDGKIAGLPSFYWVCPKCGNLYAVSYPEATCSFCGTEREKFLKIQ
jgi:rubrerythrin